MKALELYRITQDLIAQQMQTEIQVRNELWLESNLTYRLKEVRIEALKLDLYIFSL